MNRDSLLAAVEAEGQNLCRSILKEAEDAAAAVVAAAVAEAEAAGKARLDGFRAAAQGRRAAVRNLARLKVSAAECEAMRSLIDGVIDDAVAAIASMPREEYGRVMRSLFTELLGSWRADGLAAPVVLVNPADTGLMDREAGAEGISVRPDETVRLGVVFVSDDGAVRYENTVGARLERAGRPLRGAVAAVLFGLGAPVGASGRPGAARP